MTYEYGADGLRTQKKYGSTTYNYYYADGQLIRQTWGTHYIDFLYDETGSVYSIINDGTQYYFVKNLQGDVVQIRSIYGTVVVEYTYDAWGNVLSITGMYADTRPEDARGGDALSPILFGDIFLKREWLIHQK